MEICMPLTYDFDQGLPGPETPQKPNQWGPRLESHLCPQFGTAVIWGLYICMNG